MNNCPICSLPLSDTEYTYHDACINCAYCGNAVHKDIVAKLIAHTDPMNQDFDGIFHSTCHDQFLKESFKNKPVEITAGHLDYLNRMLMPFTPNMELSKETNQEVTVNALRADLADMDLDRLYYVMSNLEALAAACHIVIGKNKDYVIRRDTERQKTKFKEKEKYLADSAKRLNAQRESNIKKFERMSPEARARKNSIEGLMKLGIMEEDAIEMVDKGKK